jgi:hypothetical protein
MKVLKEPLTAKILLCRYLPMLKGLASNVYSLLRHFLHAFVHSLFTIIVRAKV